MSFGTRARSKSQEPSSNTKGTLLPCERALSPSPLRQKLRYGPGLCTFRRMQHPECISPVRPDEQQRVLSPGNTSETLLHVRHRLHFLAVDAQNHISRTQAGVVSRAARNHTFNHHSLQILSATQLLADVGSHFAKAEA